MGETVNITIWIQQGVGLVRATDFPFDNQELVDVAADYYVLNFEPEVGSVFYVQVRDTMWRFTVGSVQNPPPIEAVRGW